MTVSLRLIILDVCVCTLSTPINDDPLPSVKNPTNGALNESEVDRFKPTKYHALPNSLLALGRVALLDNCEE